METYTGLTANAFKKREHVNYRPHDPDNHKSGTRQSRHCGQLVARKIPHNIAWRILKETKTNFNPTTGFSENPKFKSLAMFMLCYMSLLFPFGTIPQSICLVMISVRVL